MRYQLFFLFFFIIAANSDEKKCLNNGKANERGICTCQTGYLGQNCSIPAVELNSTATKIPLTSNYTFTYFHP